MKKRRDKEKFANKRLLSNHLGEIISFGTSIQLMHYNSESFLNGRIICSEFDKSAYKFELSKNYEEGMIFQIIPKFKLRQEGEKIQFKDQILLKNVQLDCYVNFSTEQPIIIDRCLDEDLKAFVEPYQAPEIREIDKKSMRFESHLSHYDETKF